MSAARFQPLDFDSAFFGCAIGRVEAAALHPEEARALVDSADAAGLDCLYYLVDAADSSSCLAAQEAGFRVVDLRLRIGRPLAGPLPCPPVPAELRVRLAHERDLPALMAIARQSHRDSRFYADPRFDRERCDALYARWIERKCRGAAAAVFVAGEVGAPLGYLSCDLNPDDSGQLDLLAVDPVQRGRGVAAALTAHALAWMREQGRRRARLVTQGRNRRSLHHFGRFGFSAEQLELWLHRWRPAAPAEGAA